MSLAALQWAQTARKAMEEAGVRQPQASTGPAAGGSAPSGRQGHDATAQQGQSSGVDHATAQPTPTAHGSREHNGAQEQHVAPSSDKRANLFKPPRLMPKEARSDGASVDLTGDTDARAAQQQAQAQARWNNPFDTGVRPGWRVVYSLFVD